jgi:hypothetical protein
MKPTTGRAEAHPPEDRASQEHRDRPSAASFTRAPLVDVRRLAAVDMHGSRGTTRRRRLVLTEFALGATLGPAIALATLVTASSTFAVVLGVWILGATLNYVPLAGHAIRLSRPGALVAELAGVDVGAELRLYTVKQFWVAVPLLFVVLAATQRRPDG